MLRKKSTAEPQVVELRRYRMQPRARDTFLRLFERTFLEPLEAAGMRVLGQFRDMHDENLCVWMRGFEDMTRRRRSLETFYNSSLWRANRDACNATLADSDDVFLLRPAWTGSGIPAPASAHGSIDAFDAPAGILVVAVHFLRQPADAGLLDRCRGALSDSWREQGVIELGWYLTETAPNDFPRLPVRDGEQVLLSLALFPDVTTWTAFDRCGALKHDLMPQIEPWLERRSQVHHLLPTARSAIHA